jgi:hypothetical protein
VFNFISNHAHCRKEIRFSTLGVMRSSCKESDANPTMTPETMQNESPISQPARILHSIAALSTFYIMEDAPTN